MPEQPTLLLTGATGLLGGGLLDRLQIGNPDRHIVVITRQKDRAQQLNLRPRVVAVQGDITQLRLGVSECFFNQLTSGISEIIHCAADTRFGILLSQSRAVNTEGTRNLLNLARECRQLEKFAYISTVYVVGRSSGVFCEGAVRHQNGFSNPYQQSKYEAEQILVEAMNDIPAIVCRLSSIVGDSRSGIVQQFNYVHHLLRLFPRSLLSVAPGAPETPIDLIATDWAIAALAYLFESAFVAGRFYHICAGPQHSLRLQEMMDLTISIFENHPIGRRWVPIRLPELVNLARYEEFVEARRREGDRLTNDLLRVLGYFLPHLGIFQAFDNGKTTEALAPSGLRFPPIRDTFAKVIGYCLDTNWGAHHGRPSLRDRRPSA
jgi:nucleoside-diphosphate-sugar epimerase